jgi:hypothetical protein
MANSITNVVVGKPLVTGGVLTAPVGTVLPSDPLSALNAAFKAVGYITDAGVTKSEKRNTGTINAWGGDTIAATAKGYDVTIKLDLAEFLNAITQGLIYGTANVVATPAVAAIASPVLSSPTTATTGGTLSAATRYYKATYTNAAGETVGSNEVSVTSTGSTSANTFTIGAAPTGATGTKIYVSTTAGAEVLLDTLLTTPTTYTDNGSKTPGAATVPTVGSTGSKGNQLKVTATSQPTPHNSWVFEIIADARKVRLVVPDGKVMDIGDTVFKDDQVAAASLTLQCFPDATGAYYYVYTDDGVRS